MGTVVGCRRGVENRPAGGGVVSDFSCREGEALFAPGRGKGTSKLQKRALKMHFLREFCKFVQNMCDFAFLRHIFYDFYLQDGKNFLVTKGGSIKFILGTRGGQ